MRLTCAASGLASVVVFVAALLVIASLTPGFDAWQSYVSELGADGQPYAVWWNLVGFLGVGIALTVFGRCYGRLLGDRWVSLLLAAFGVGFAVAALPIESTDSQTPLTKAHIVAICLSLAGWSLGLARIAGNRSLDHLTLRRANLAAVLMVAAMLGGAVGVWSMPVAHRLLFAVVFGWVAVTSIAVLAGRDAV